MPALDRSDTMRLHLVRRHDLRWLPCVTTAFSGVRPNVDPEPAEFIIFSTKFIIFSTKFIILIHRGQLDPSCLMLRLSFLMQKSSFSMHKSSFLKRITWRRLGCMYSERPRTSLPKFNILNTKFIISNADFIILNAKFIIFN